MTQYVCLRNLKKSKLDNGRNIMAQFDTWYSMDICYRYLNLVTDINIIVDTEMVMIIFVPIFENLLGFDKSRV